MCGYFRCAPSQRAARVLVAGETTYQRLEYVLDRVTARLDVGWLVIGGSKDIARRWAVLREVNIIETTSLAPWGQVQHATHVIQFGGEAEHALLAEDADKPVRVIRP